MSNMYINKALRKDIPSDAIILTKKEVLDMHWNTVNQWIPKSDVWPFRYGMAFFAAMSATTNLNIVHHYRNKLKLGNYGRITMAVPTTFFPCIGSIMAHYGYVTSNIFLGEECPVCIQTRAAVLQVGIGVLLPLIATPFAALFYASSYYTYKVPPLTLKNLPVVFKLWLEMTRKLKSKLPIMIAGNAIAASALTYFEADSFYKIQSVIYEREENFKKMMSKGI